jgi:glucose-6-phosphate isomerase, archaeal
MSFLPLRFDCGLNLAFDASHLSFQFGADVFGPEAEMRSLDAIRRSLLDPNCAGPDPVYGICMDVGQSGHRQELERRYLLFGVVAYAAGCLGPEPVRSQGHVHATAPHSGWSPPELFEIWQGRAVVYMQERLAEDPGRCFAVEAGVGDHVVVPPGWAHFVANADPHSTMVFAALCDRQYGFVYDGVRARGGLAWFPVCAGASLDWQANPAYGPSCLRTGAALRCSTFGVRPGIPLYRQFAEDPDALQWVSEPDRAAALWNGFDPLDLPVRACYSRT